MGKFVEHIVLKAVDIIEIIFIKCFARKLIDK
jgi:hypothetical protein